MIFMWRRVYIFFQTYEASYIIANYMHQTLYNSPKRTKHHTIDEIECREYGLQIAKLSQILKEKI